MKRIVAVALVALFVACDTVPHHTLTLTFNDSGERVTIESSTTLPSLKNAEDREKVAQLRDALLGGHDEWALRFQHAAPERDRVTYDRTAGDLTEVTRSATIDADDLQKFFYDLPVTAKVTRGDGWVELGIYPGASTRATREERDDFEKRMNDGAAGARRYFDAMRFLYEYLDERPQRAHDVFDALFRDEDDPRPMRVSKTEVDLIKAVRDAMTALFDAGVGGDVAREADDVSNPFPADVVVHTPGEPTLIEGFVREEKGLVIRPKTLFEALASLEGRWIWPDPIAVSMRSPEMKQEQVVAFFAKAKRRAEPVVGLQEVVAEMRERLKPADHYRVRFAVKAPEP